MTKITAELGDLSYIEFKTKEEWKAYLAPLQSRNKKHYSPEPENTHPYSFPCLMIYDDNRIIYHPNGNDAFMNFFVYDYSLAKKEPDEDSQQIDLDLQKDHETST